MKILVSSLQMHETILLTVRAAARKVSAMAGAYLPALQLECLHHQANLTCMSALAGGGVLKFPFRKHLPVSLHSVFKFGCRLLSSGNLLLFKLQRRLWSLRLCQSEMPPARWWWGGRFALLPWQESDWTLLVHAIVCRLSKAEALICLFRSAVKNEGHL